MSAQTTDVSHGVLPWSRETASASDEAGFHALYAAVSRPLFAYLVGVTGRRELADDLLQETFCRFLTRQPAAMPADETRRYLFRIATNLLRDRWRRKDDLPAPEAREVGVTKDLDARIDVRRTMQLLKPRERELLWLAYVEGMSHAEMATVTGLSALSVRLLSYRARGKAAALLLPRKDDQ